MIWPFRRGPRPTDQILQALNHGAATSLELSTITGLSPGKTLATLYRLLNNGTITRHEECHPTPGRPARIFYLRTAEILEEP